MPRGYEWISFWGSCYSFGKQAQRLALGRDGGCQINTRASELAFGFGRLEFDAQTGRQIGLTEAERRLEEAA